MWWFPDGNDHAEAEVAFVTDPVLGIGSVQDARAAHRSAVVATAVDGVGDPAQPAGSHDLEVPTGRDCAEVEPNDDRKQATPRRCRNTESVKGRG